MFVFKRFCETGAARDSAPPYERGSRIGLLYFLLTLIRLFLRSRIMKFVPEGNSK